MGNRKITELTALTAPVEDDLLTIVDISEGLNVNKNKKISYGELFKSVIDGTASAPSISFDSSTTTGLYRSGTNEISISTGGTQRLKIEASGATTIFGNLTVQGTQTTVSSTTLEVTDKNIELAKGAGNDTAADGGGITLDSSDGDKLFKWLNSTDSWTSSEHLEVASGKTFRINGNNVLSQTTLGSTVVSSSLTSVGTLGALTVTNAVTAGSLDISGGADIDGTLEADAYTVNGTALDEYISDTVGAMVSSNTETNITVTYDDSDNTLDFVIGTLNQDTTGNAATATALETARTIGGVSFNGTANINLPGVNQTGDQNTTGSAATLTTARTIGGVSFDGSANINLPGVNAAGNQNTSGTAAGLTGTPNITVGVVTAGSLDISGSADIDGTLEADAYTVNGTALDEYIADTIGGMVSSNTETNITVTYQDSDNTLDFSVTNITGNAATATALETARTIGGVSFDGTGNITLPGVNATGNQNTTGSAATLTTARTIGGVSFDGSGNITLPGVNSVGNQNTTGSAATLTTARTIGGVSFDGSANITLPGVNSAGNQNTSGTSAGLTGTPNITVADVVAASLDISGNADIDGTLEADAITVDGTALNEFIADTVGGMVSSNTETNITVTYEDSDNTLDFVIGTLNQNTTGSAATLTTARTIGGVSFDGSANINLPGVNTAGNQNTSGTAANLSGTPNITVGDVVAASLDISGNVDVDGTLETDALTINGTSLSETIADTVGAMVTSNTETGITVTYDDADNTLDFVVGTLNQSTTGNAATATALQNARTINGVSFDGTGNITVTAAAGTLTGSTLTSGVTASSLTSVGTLTGLTTSGNILMTGTGCIDIAAGTSAQRPGSPNAGMFRFNTTDGKFEGHDGSSWGEIGGGGGGASFYINTLSSSSNTGGGSASFNGTAYRFTLSNAPATGNAAQMLVSVGGVIQKANSGTSQPSEGYAISGNDIIFGAAPASAASWFIITYGALNAGTPTDNTVTTAKIVDDAVTGAKLSNNLDIPDNNKIRFGTGNDLEIYHSGSHSFIKDTGTGNLAICGSIVALHAADATENMILCSQNGAVQLYYDNSKKFETTSVGVTVSGTLTTTSHIDLPDSCELLVGNSDDLRVYHSGTTNYIVASSHNLHIDTAGGNENAAKFIQNGAVELYYDNGKKFETTSTGALVGGIIQAKQNSGNAAQTLLKLTNNDTTASGETGQTADIEFEFTDNTNTTYKAAKIGAYKTADWVGNVDYDAGLKFFTVNNSSSFENTYTERLAITENGELKIPDNGKFVAGAGADLQIYHDGTNSRIKNTTGSLYIVGDNIGMLSTADDWVFKFSNNGATELYYDGSKKFNTESSGVQVYGNLRLDDNNQFQCGNAQDLTLHHNGTDSFIDNNTGDLYIQTTGSGDDISIQSADDFTVQVAGTEIAIQAFGDAGVKLYYDNSKKFETVSAGVQVTGSLGIGTAPEEIFHIKGPSEAVNARDGVLLQHSTDSDAADTGLPLVWSGRTSSSLPNYGLASICGRKENSTGGNCASYLQLATCDAAGSLAERLRIASNGRLLLGTQKTYSDQSYYDDITINNSDGSGASGGTGITLISDAASWGGLLFGDENDHDVGHIKYDHNTNSMQFTTSTSESMRLTSGGSVKLPDNGKIEFGGAQHVAGDLQIYHDGSNSYVNNATGNLYIYTTTNNSITLGKSGEISIKAVPDGAVELYHDNSKKAYTYSNGLACTANLSMVDDGKVVFGSGNDLEIWHDASNSRLKNITGSLWLQSDTGIRFTDAGVNESMAAFYDNAAVELYYDGSKKFETTSSGVKVTGTLEGQTDSATSTHTLPVTVNSWGWRFYQNSSSSPYGLEIKYSGMTRDDSVGEFINCLDTTAVRFKVTSDGDVWNHDDSYSGSDQTLKENIVDASSKLEDLKKLKVRNFNWKADQFPNRSKKKMLGFIAQEVETVFPSLIKEYNITGDNDNPVMKKAIKQAWAPILVKALQEAITKIETLEAKVAALEAA